jgi:hypothetical protein
MLPPAQRDTGATCRLAAAILLALGLFSGVRVPVLAASVTAGQHLSWDTTDRADAMQDDYLDDRSSPESLVRSYYNAINRREYVRAYSYWEDAAAQSQLPPFPDFEHGFAETSSVTLTLGAVTSGVGAGQLFYSVPMELEATYTDGSTQLFVGCLGMHLSRPVLQAVPPYRPMGIRSAVIEELPIDADPVEALNAACPRS